MRALVAGAQALVREGLKRVTLQIEGTCEFIETADVAKARAALRGTTPFDIAWFDKALFTADEIARLRRDQPRLRLLTLSAQERAPQSAQLLVAGISVLVPKSASTDILAVALRLAMAGNVCVRGNSPAHPPTTFTD